MLANKLQESGKCLQKTQRARSRGEGASHWQRGFELENCRDSEAALAGGHDAAEVETKATASGQPATCLSQCPASELASEISTILSPLRNLDWAFLFLGVTGGRILSEALRRPMVSYI